ncbi:hypothetical protein Nepgr_030756 [Nepenthes gracilis]|uniref:Uncharacterized protein n=1 Tax=Nepenthes gracilis TaxID=150966 RepID=A0AAD3TH58_NEPGR|nr:hypothetical protein Nepgr_030756 [Nepenthes gracilis]
MGRRTRRVGGGWHERRKVAGCAYLGGKRDEFDLTAFMAAEEEGVKSLIFNDLRGGCQGLKKERGRLYDSVDELLSSEMMKMGPRCFLPNTPRAEMLKISRDLSGSPLSAPEMRSVVDLLMVGTCCHCARSPFRIFAAL